MIWIFAFHQVPVIECISLKKSGVDEADHFTDQVAEIEAELQAAVVQKVSCFWTSLHSPVKALQDERDMLAEIEQVEKKLNKEGIKATSAVDQHELTPPKLMLGYFFMVRLFIYWQT